MNLEKESPYSLITVFILTLLLACFLLLIILKIESILNISKIWKILSYSFDSNLPGIGSLLLFFRDKEALFGLSLKFITNPQDRFEKFLKTTINIRSNCSLNLGFMKLYGLYNLDDIKIILNHPEAIEKPQSLYNVIFSVTGILNSPVAAWKKMRPIVNQAFLFNKLKNYFEHLNLSNQKLVSELNLHLNNEIDMEDLICQTNIKFMLRALFDYEGDEEIIRTMMQCYYKHTELGMQRLLKPWLYIDYFYKKCIAKQIEELTDMILKLPIQVLQSGKRKYYEMNMQDSSEGIKGTKFKDEDEKFIYYLVRLMEDGVVTEKELVGEIAIVLLGTDLVIVSTSSLLLALAINPEIQDKVYNELYSVFGDSDREVTWSDLSQLKYLEQCMFESMRRFPTDFAKFRKPSEDITLSNFTAPKDCILAIPTYPIHMDEERYPEPEKFDPERFNLENMKKRHPYNFIPFSAGPRGCIGKKLALAKMKFSVSYVLRNFKLSSNLKMDELKFQFNSFIRLYQPYKVTLTSRIREPIQIKP